MQKIKGLYLGTEINGKWWKRYTKDKSLARGNGGYWYDEKGFYFLRRLMKEPIFISFDKMVEIKIGRWHSGRWAWGNTILKIIWKKGDLKLNSGFIVSKNKESTLKLKEILEDKIRL